MRATGCETAVLQAENLLVDYFGLQSPGWQRDVTAVNIKFGPGYKDYENVLQVGPIAPPCTCCVCHGGLVFMHACMPAAQVYRFRHEPADHHYCYLQMPDRSPISHVL